MSAVDSGRHVTRGRLVRIAFLVRLLALGYSTVSLVAGSARPGAVVLLGALVLTSHLGLQYRRVRSFVVRHPAAALLDLVPVAVAPLVVGPDSPILLVGLSSALLVGVLYPIRLVVPLVLLLVTTQVRAATAWGADPLAALNDPVALVTVAALGVAVRRLAEQEAVADQERGRAAQAAAAAQERLRLARDLHDTVAKSVQGVALAAAALPGWVERDPAQAAQHARTVADGARAAVAAARGLLVSLRLDDTARPFAEVVEQVVRRWDDQHGTETDVDLRDVPHLSPGHRHEVLCAMSEALENVCRHAPGASVLVTLAPDGDDAVLTVTDTGPGIPAGREEQARDDGHFGLSGMRERLGSVGGSVLVSSPPGAGTRVSLRVATERPPVADRSVDGGGPGSHRRRPPSRLAVEPGGAGS